MARRGGAKQVATSGLPGSAEFMRPFRGWLELDDPDPNGNFGGAELGEPLHLVSAGRRNLLGLEVERPPLGSPRLRASFGVFYRVCVVLCCVVRARARNSVSEDFPNAEIQQLGQLHLLIFPPDLWQLKYATGVVLLWKEWGKRAPTFSGQSCHVSVEM